MTEENAQNNAVDAPQASARQLAYQRVYPKLQELEGKPLLPINVMIPTVYSVAMGVLNALRPWKEKLLLLQDINQELIGNTEDYLLALGYAHGLLKAAEAPVASIPELYASLLKERELLVTDCQALAHRGYMPEEKLNELRGPISHGDTAFDVIALVMILRGIWPNIQGKTALSLSDLERAETTADRLLTAVGERAVAGEQQSIAAVQRQRAFTLFVQGYEEWRRGMSHFRWHQGDLEQLIPSIYSNKVGRRRRADGKADDEPAPSEPAPTPPTSGAAAGATSSQQALPVGHPDSSPFV